MESNVGPRVVSNGRPSLAPLVGCSRLWPTLGSTDPPLGCSTTSSDYWLWYQLRFSSADNRFLLCTDSEGIDWESQHKRFIERPPEVLTYRWLECKAIVDELKAVLLWGILQKSVLEWVESSRTNWQTLVSDRQTTLVSALLLHWMARLHTNTNHKSFDSLLTKCLSG